jgi:hypothetical protein
VGLERKVVREIAVDRPYRKQEVAETVLELQRKADERRLVVGFASEQNAAHFEEAQAEVMRQACEELVKPHDLKT